MDIANIGFLEILIILVLTLVLFKPQDLAKTARKIGAWLYRASHSPLWRDIVDTSQQVREIPRKIIRDAGIAESLQETIQQVNKPVDLENSGTAKIQKNPEAENTIFPPAKDTQEDRSNQGDTTTSQ